MNTSGNQLHMETEKKLREALLYYMEQGKDPTVGQLCQRAQINRSTFYRHYTDVYDLMNRVDILARTRIFTAFICKSTPSARTTGAIKDIGKPRCCHCFSPMACKMKRISATITNTSRRVLSPSFVSGWKTDAGKRPPSWPASCAGCCRENRGERAFFQEKESCAKKACVCRRKSCNRKMKQGRRPPLTGGLRSSPRGAHSAPLKTPEFSEK